MKNILLLLTIVFSCYSISGNSQTITNTFYNVNAGNGNGLRFWKNNNYKIHMGNAAENKYGPVTDYSIKMNMNASAARGWTWGVHGKEPVMAVNTSGNFQNKGWIRTENGNIYFGDAQRIHGNKSSVLYVTNNHSTVSQIILRDKEATTYGRLVGSGNGANFGLYDGDGNWSYLAVKDKYTGFRINNIERMRIASTGLVTIPATRDASGVVGSGALEIGGKLRIDANEIITNTNTHLYFNHDNNGDVVFDNNTLRVRSSENVVTIGNVSNRAGNYKLYVDNGILTEKVRVSVQNTADWADYVFEEDYELMPLRKLSAFIEENHHLPGVPSAEDVVKDGLDMAKTDAILLEKLEEAYLYILSLEERITNLEKSSPLTHK
jgi:hypothetical protein